MIEGYCTMTTIAGMLVGQTGTSVGKALKEMNLRLPNGKPSPQALAAGLVRPTDGPQPWITLWLWHKAENLELLEGWGMTRKDTAQTM